ncbi:hypothetical protein [Amycolatopsis sp. 195334CR]|uniref:sunset domain-containing protein n=1 Tax=Amycolatopsis sp. 195334CR TaxID=2814588 RepID=UPI001A8C2D49|nr:hypothetical protein [Amycolatopsis sp. 195334CR]MBN6036185.1 hypothetical protein [Amycolatopsis sp. 195334CR]
MSIFTQVWLWSVAAFAIGVLLTVLLLVLPARKQVKELQRRLTAAEAAPREATRQFTPEPRAEREPTRTFDPGPAAAATAYQPAFEPEAPRGFESEAPRGFESERTEAVVPTRTFEPEPPRGFEPADQSRQTYEAEQAYAGQQEFESERTFEPEQPYAAERQYEAEQEFGGDRQHEGERQYDASQPYEGEQFEAERGNNEPAYDNGQPYEDGQAYANESTTAYQPALDPEPIQSDIELRPHYEEEAEPHHESVEQSWFSREQKAEETVYYNGSGLLDKDEDRPGSLFTPAPAEEEPPAYAFSDEEAEPSYEEELAAERTQVLPKRQPRQAPPGGFDPPQPIEPSVRQIERREPALEQGQNSGSLFEPAGTNGSIPEPPPARDFVPETSVPLGPFGPGSAMPKPGGGRPSDDFTVKASVTALRYCTEDSPQFPRMVAEVWFRSATDAERVGFRPLG